MRLANINTLPTFSTLLHNAKAHHYGLMALRWGMIATCCWLLSYWTWVFITPAATPVALPATARAPVSAETIINAHLFGISASSSVVPVQSISALGLKLHGVFAGEGKKGIAAIINVAQKDQAFTLGSEIVAGAVLTHVYADYVELKYHGALERLNLERGTQTAGLIVIAPPASPQPISPPITEIPPAPAAQHGRHLLMPRL